MANANCTDYYRQALDVEPRREPIVFNTPIFTREEALKQVKTALRVEYTQMKKSHTGLSTRSLAAKLGWSYTKVGRMLNPNDGSEVGVGDLLLMTEVLGCNLTLSP